MEVEFTPEGSSLEFLQELQGRTYSGWIFDDFKAWMPRTKLLQSSSKQSRMIRVVIKL